MNLPLVLALIPLWPLLGSVFSFLNGLKNRSSAGWIATGAAVFSFATTLFLVVQRGEAVIETNLFSWFVVHPLHVDFLFRFDNLTAVMCLVITGIGSLIHLYSIAYMAEDEGRHRFFSYLNLFLFAMLLLVLGGNLLVLFVGWEGVGLCSYLLIGFWFKNLDYAKAGRKAFVVNRIGDAGFLLAVFLLLQQFHTIDFVELSRLISGNLGATSICTIVAFCLFIGATGKSAQIPLYVWLPDAMAGPTPVSALIHAATMVTAGVYLFARMHFVFDLAPLVGAIACGVALATAFFAATIALTQNDIKKVLAYSTVSQLGFMFMAASVGAYWVAVFHLVTHAFFKACLFLGAGSVIHGCHHEQDMRKMGGLSKLMPLTFVTYLISTFAIAGIFPFAGYQSKHAILAALKETHNPYLAPYAHLLVLIATITALLTAFYMMRSVALTFFGSYRGGHSDDTHHHDDHHGHAHHPHESPWKMTFPLIVLATLATAGGVVLQKILPEFLAPVVGEVHEHHAETIVESLMGSWVGIVGVALALVLYLRFPMIPKMVFRAGGPLSRLMERKYLIDELYRALIIRPLELMSVVLWKGVDQGMVDGTVNGTAAVIETGGEIIRITQTGQIRHYALFIFLGSLFFLAFYFVL